MRIIAGERRGHKIEGPGGRDMRPTSDLVRESIFNILGTSIEDRPVLDLFAGTGALGLEALSRGASSALFVERDRNSVALIRRNIATLRYGDVAHILSADAYRWARAYLPEGQAPPVVFIDPPYRDYESGRRPALNLLGELVSKLPAGSILVVESDSTLDPASFPDAESWDIRRYGGTRVAFLTISEQPPSS